MHAHIYTMHKRRLRWNYHVSPPDLSQEKCGMVWIEIKVLQENMMNNTKCRWELEGVLAWGKRDCHNPTLRECEDETHTPEMGNWESSGTPKTLKFNCRGQNTSHWGILYIIRKLLKCRCRKWVCMSHLDICHISYSKKKGEESNWQFDSRPLKVKNWPDPNACRWSATHRWRALNKSYNFGCREEAQRILYGGRWWLPPSPSHGELTHPQVLC